ncbi:hypothetical protein Glove_91g117 [Diversispora epigaea]|uniref:Ty3 transposon capsid-like protein domain-containing protein n=1 Tax=Diversispora epigaea TaxID=1348612 RepID=A0A397JFZ6_9GLOM|nr:hypothetical protein Glove_91g117 [Diversispora epigaea]
MSSIELLNNLVSQFSLEYSKRVREIVQQAENNSYPSTFNSQQLQELEQIRFMSTYNELLEQHQYDTRVHEQKHKNSSTVLELQEYCNLCFSSPLNPPQHFSHFWNWYISYSAKSYSSKTIEYFNKIIKGLLEKPPKIDIDVIREFIFSFTYIKVPGDFTTIQNAIIKTLKTQISTRRKPVTTLPSNIISTITSTLNPLTPTESETTMSLSADQLKEILKKVTDGFKETAQTIKAETHVFPIGPFYGKATEDPVEWIASFNRAANANNWTSNRKLQIAPGYLKGVAAHWCDDSTITYWDNNSYPDRSFVSLFTKRFTTLENKNKWHYELHNIKQEKNERVDEYSVQFQKLAKKVDPTDAIPDDYKTRMYISGLNEEVAAMVAIDTPATLTDTIKAAAKVEAGKYYSK